jgi:transmembrane sensor
LLAQRAVSVLVAGQQAQVQAGAAQIRSVTSLERARLDAWRKGKLYFENQPLQSVLDEIGRYSTARILVEDQALGRLPIGGTFQTDAQGVEALLGMLREGFGLSVRRERDGSIRIGGGPAEKKDSAPPGDSTS